MLAPRALFSGGAQPAVPAAVPHAHLRQHADRAARRAAWSSRGAVAAAAAAVPPLQRSTLDAPDAPARAQLPSSPARPAAAPLPAPGPQLASLDGLTFHHIARPTGGASGLQMQSLARTAAGSHGCQVLEALSKTALLLRDSAVSAARGTPPPSPCAAGSSMQGLFQSGYDVMIALLQALPQCRDAYGPAAVVPETCVALFHVHNVLLQAAYASRQDFEPYTSLVQAGLSLYLVKAPRNVLSFDNMDALMDALAHQDLWRFNRLLWTSLQASLPLWDTAEDMCSVIHGCELQAQAAVTAAAATLPAPPTPACAPRGPPGSPDSSRPSKGAVLALLEGGRTSGHASTSGFQHATPPSSPPSVRAHATPTQQQQSHGRACLPLGDESPRYRGSSAAVTAAERQAELDDYARLMSDTIRCALESAATRLSSAPSPHAEAWRLLEVAVAFDGRQRSPSTPLALRYTFIPGSEWLSRVAAAGVQAGGGPLDAGLVANLLTSLEALAPRPFDSVGSSHRWLDALAQAAVENAVMRRIADRSWSVEQAMSVLKALCGKCQAPPGDSLCAAVEGMLLSCGEAKQDMGLLCAMLQDAVDLSDAQGGGLSAAHQSLVRVLLNKAIYLVGSAAAEGSTLQTVPSHASTSGGSHASWSNREFLFDRFPRLLQAARRFGYPLQAFCPDEYGNRLYDYLASAPGHELVAVGPEGLTRVLMAVASTPCAADPSWAAAFERACMSLVAVQFSVGYTHPKRWLRLLETVVAELPMHPMPALAGGVKALMVRLCDVNRHAEYFWSLLPLVGKLERRAAAAGAGPRHHHRDTAPSGGSLRSHLAYTSACSASASAPKGRSLSSQRSHQRGRSNGGGLPNSAPSCSSSGASLPVQGKRAIVPAPDISKHLVSEEEYSRFSEEVGQRLALSMACMRDLDRVAHLSVLGIPATE